MAMKKGKSDFFRTPPAVAVVVAQQAPEEALEITVVTGPTYTIHADTRWGMLAMIWLHRLVMEWDAAAELRREIAAKMREFELWEEAHRDPAA